MEQKIVPEKNNIIGKNLRRLRIKQKFTQEKLVAQLQLKGLKMTRGSYAKIEAGLQNIRVSELTALRDALNTTFDELLNNMEKYQ